MAVAIEALPEVAEAAEGGSEAAGGNLDRATAGHYQRLTKGGAPPGRDTLARARQLAVQEQSKPATPPSRSAPRRGAAAAPASKSSGPGRGKAAAGLARGAYQGVSSPSAAAQTLTKLIWAAALGLIALQIAAEATGQQWSFNLPAQGKKLTKQPYRPLYVGQPADAMPGYPISVLGTGVPTPGATTGGGTALVLP